MEQLLETIQRTPIIDHHAHNLLVPDLARNPSLLSITTEASGPALEHTSSSLAHIRAVKQLAGILNCEPTWDAVEDCLREKRKSGYDVWAERCFEGIETVLIDDGLAGHSVHPYGWHNRLTRSKCKRIVRIEAIAEDCISCVLGDPSVERKECMDRATSDFKSLISQFVRMKEVAGFKSVICYRTGLKLPTFEEIDPSAAMESFLQEFDSESFDCPRLQHDTLGPYFVHLTAQVLAEHENTYGRKPFQFHTGLGDNDLVFSLSSPSYMQSLIESYPSVNFVLLHASYPFTKEAAYLATVYENVFMDIGEVFPMISKDGQEKVIRDALELCPSEKLTWSTDGHYFPETYLLAVLQVREAMEQVFCGYVQTSSLTIPQACKIVQDILFNTSNKLYNLNLELELLSSPSPSANASGGAPPSYHEIATHQGSWAHNFSLLTEYVKANSDIKFLWLQWLDYTATLRVRVLPIKRAIEIFRNEKLVGITKCVFGLLQDDEMVKGFSPAGEFKLYPHFNTLRRATRPSAVTVQCEFRQANGDEVPDCPRSVLRRIVDRASIKFNKLTFLVGFEIEVVFLKRSVDSSGTTQVSALSGRGHSWSAARALQNNAIMNMIEEILSTLESIGIDLQQVHPESCPGQYEFITGPQPPLQAADALISTRQVISTIAEKYGFRATLFPKPVAQAAGTGAHIHVSMSPPDQYESFYAGVLKHLRAIVAFTYSNQYSYDRLGDGNWSGGRWVTWGTQNRETPLRKIENSHWEIKCVDGLSSPYLVLAALLAAGLEGIRQTERLVWKDCISDPAQLSTTQRSDMHIVENLPASMQEALEALQQDGDLAKAMGPEAVATYLTVKRAEYAKLRVMYSGHRQAFMIERY